MVFDTGVLLELATGSAESAAVRDAVVGGTLSAITGELNVLELGYLLCRAVGPEAASRSVALLRRSSEVRVLPCSEFLDSAAKMKCERAISLVDCVTVAMGDSTGMPVLFSRKEQELSKEMKRSPFRAKLLFLRDA